MKTDEKLLMCVYWCDGCYPVKVELFKRDDKFDIVLTYVNDSPAKERSFNTEKEAKLYLHRNFFSPDNSGLFKYHWDKNKEYWGEGK